MVPKFVTPGAYVEETSSGVRNVVRAATSITAFVGRTWRGSIDEPLMVSSFADYEREFGGLWRGSSVSYAVQQYFLNGGGKAIVVRVVNGSTEGSTAAAPVTLSLRAGTSLTAASTGSWGRNLRASVNHAAGNTADASLFDLTIFDDPASQLDSERRGGSGLRETFRDVSIDANSERFVSKVLREQSQLVRVQKLGAKRPRIQSATAPMATSGSDGVLTGSVAIATIAAASEIIGDVVARTGVNALLKTSGFNLLCIPPLVFARETLATTWERMEIDVPTHVLQAAAAFCTEQRAMLIVDAPRDWDFAAAMENIANFRESLGSGKNVAVYFPRLRMIDPLRSDPLEDFAPCGAIAGIMARTDASLGVWKAPAGANANLAGTLGLSIKGAPGNVTNEENHQLNPLGVNCLRNFAATGYIVWGARTLGDYDWLYIPVRRLALFIEESVVSSTQWAKFEPNDESMWAQIRLDIEAFMHALFVEGAFQGSTSREAFFVKCGHETTTNLDLENGIFNVEIGFAPLRPAEFIVIRIQQAAMQAKT